jgi:4-hydroxy-tetrahydrodipicolinate synthase
LIPVVGQSGYTYVSITSDNQKRCKMNALKSGVYIAMVTPWSDGGGIDWATLRAYVTGLRETSVAGLVVAGTTGEGMALNPKEYWELIARVVEWSGGKKHIMAGVSGVLPDQVIPMIKGAEQAGADSVLALTPFYIRPSQKGLLAFFHQVHEQTSLPIVLYNNPGRTCVNIDVDTVCQLATYPRIVGIKDSTPDLSRPTAMRARIHDGNFQIFSGEDATFVPFVAGGGSGIISVQAGIVPMLYGQIWQALKMQKWQIAQEKSQILVPLHRAMNCGANPGPIKYAASVLGWGSDQTRFPLGALAPSGCQAIQEALSALAPFVYAAETMASRQNAEQEPRIPSDFP